MALRRRILQLAVLTAMGVAAHLTAPRAQAASAPGLYCTDTCAAARYCDSGGGGICTRLSCHAVNHQWYSWTLWCWNLT
jgi:hypothetical protein